MATTAHLLLVVLAACASAGAAVLGPAAAAAPEADRYKIPEGFLFGAGVSAIQTEGAWNEENKAPSAADVMLHSPLFAKTLGSHDKAADSYHRYKDDVAMAKQLKLNVYRFSISWARLLPEADATKPNPFAVKYYHSLIDEILAANITPMVTLYHFDHPQILQQENFVGWEDRRMVDKFAEYAEYAFGEFGDKVKHWTTLNEPNQYCMYFNMLFVLGGQVRPEQVDIHRCMHHTILAHAKAYGRYKQKYFKQQQGMVGFTTLMAHAQPNTTLVQDMYAAEVFNHIHFGKMLHPFVYGDYPDSVKKLLPKLPAFSDDEKIEVKGSSDFFGLNIYNGVTVSYDPEAGSKRPTVPIMSQLMESMPFVDLGKIEDLMAFDRINPEVMERSVVWAWQRFGIPIMITENGYSGPNDKERAVYLSSYMRALVRAMHDFDVKVLGYSAWSLIDAFEWSAGYSRPFGLVHVDYENGTLERSLKPYSSKFFNELAETRVIPLVESESSNAAVSSLTAGAGLTLALGVLASRLAAC